MKDRVKADSLIKAAPRRMIHSDRSVTIGLVASLPSNISALSDTIAERYFYRTDGSEVIKDTLTNSIGNKGSITFPLIIGGGFTYSTGQKLCVGADFTMGDWSNYKAFGQSDQLSNSMKMAAGLEYTPKGNEMFRGNEVKKITGKLTYRFGAHYEKTYLNLKGTQLDEYGVAFGFAIPLTKAVPGLRLPSYINFAVDLGRRGTLVNQLIREDYIKLHLGFSLNDKWFGHYKYD